MFDKYYRSDRLVPVTKTVNVTENKAPTDESMRLLREMEDAILARVVGSAECRNDVHANIVEIQHRANDPGSDVWLGFALNGKEYRIKIDIGDQRLAMAVDSNAFIQDIAERVAKAITRELLPHLVMKLAGRDV